MCLEKIHSSPSSDAFALKLELNLPTQQLRGAWIALILGPMNLRRDLACKARPSPAAGGSGEGTGGFAWLNCPQHCNLQRFDKLWLVFGFISLYETAATNEVEHLVNGNK